jgi:hypothetical protein
MRARQNRAALWRAPRDRPYDGGNNDRPGEGAHGSSTRHDAGRGAMPGLIARRPRPAADIIRKARASLLDGGNGWISASTC